MGKPTGFLEYEKKERAYEKPEARKKNYAEFLKRMDNAEIRTQAARCRSARLAAACNGRRDIRRLRHPSLGVQVMPVMILGCHRPGPG